MAARVLVPTPLAESGCRCGLIASAAFHDPWCEDEVPCSASMLATLRDSGVPTVVVLGAGSRAEIGPSGFLLQASCRGFSFCSLGQASARAESGATDTSAISRRAERPAGGIVGTTSSSRTSGRCSRCPSYSCIINKVLRRGSAYSRTYH